MLWGSLAFLAGAVIGIVVAASGGAFPAPYATGAEVCTTQ